jgi:hypothetical protein
MPKLSSDSKTESKTSQRAANHGRFSVAIAKEEAEVTATSCCEDSIET